MFYSFDNPRACVMVKRIGSTKTYQIIPGEIQLMKAKTPLTDLPGIKIISPEGAEIKASGTFLITAETIGTFHLVTDMF